MVTVALRLLAYGANVRNLTIFARQLLIHKLPKPHKLRLSSQNFSVPVTGCIHSRHVTPAKAGAYTDVRPATPRSIQTQPNLKL